jgi:hypothetical protein
MFVVEAIGFAIGLKSWRGLDRGQRLMALWLGASALTDLAAFALARSIGNTQPAARVWYALSVAFALEALARYQGSSRLATMLRVGIVGYLALWLVLLVTVEPPLNYSTYSAPVHAIVILAAAVVTLFRRVALSRGDLVEDSGFLFSVALIAYAVPSALQTLVAQLWNSDYLSRTVAYYTAHSVVSVLAALVVIRGVSIGSAPARRVFA